MTITALLLVFLLTLFPLGQLTRVQILPSIALYSNDIVVVLILITWGFSKLFTRKPYAIPSLTKALGLFIFTCTLSLVVNSTRFSPNELSIGSLYLIRYTCYTGLYFVVHDLVAQKKIAKNHLIYGLVFAGVLSALLGLLQYALYPNLRNLLYLGWDPHEFRVFGTFFDSGYLGIILVLTIILTASIKTRLRLGIIAFTCSVLALTYSRSSYLALLAVSGAYSMLTRTWKPATLATILILFTVFTAPRPSETSEGVKLERTSTVHARVQNYYDTAEIIGDNPIFGIGFNTLRYERRDRGNVPVYDWQHNHAAAGADNSFLFVWATTGIVGLTAYLYLCFKVAVLSLQSSYAKIVFPSIIAIFTHSFFLNTQFYPWVLAWFFILLGALLDSKKR